MACLALLFAGLLSACEQSAEDGAANLRFEEAYLFPPFGDGRIGSAYVTVVNPSREDDRLVSVQGDIAEKIEMHAVGEEDGMMTMRKREVMGAPSQGELILTPGGDHLMLFGLADGLEDRDAVTLTLEFERAGVVDVDFEVRER